MRQLEEREKEARELRFVQGLLPRAIEFYQKARGIRDTRGYHMFGPEWDRYRAGVYERLRTARPTSEGGRALLEVLERSLIPGGKNVVERRPRDFDERLFFRGLRERAQRALEDILRIHASVNRRLAESEEIGGERNALRQFLGEARGPKNLPPRVLGGLYEYYMQRRAEAARKPKTPAVDPTVVAAMALRRGRIGLGSNAAGKSAPTRRKLEKRRKKKKRR